MNSDFVDSSKRQTTFNLSDRRKLNDLNLIRNDPINPRKALDFKLRYKVTVYRLSPINPCKEIDQ